jgi:hypothetical protein
LYNHTNTHKQTSSSTCLSCSYGYGLHFYIDSLL